MTLCTLTLVASGAGAEPFFDLEWTSTTGAGTPGGTVIEAAPGDVLTATIIVTPPPPGITAYSVSLEFDTDLENELDLVATTEEDRVGSPTFPCSPFPTCFTIQLHPETPGVGSAVDSSPSSGGFVYSYETLAGDPLGRALRSWIYPTYFEIGTVTFEVNGALADGADVTLGLFNVGTDGVWDENSNPIGAAFGSLSVVPIPEPATLTILSLGLVGLVVGRRRSRS